MKTRFLLLLLLFALPPLVGSGVKAQSMSDDQVLSYIAKETQSGTPQSTIATQLIAKGVTMTQLQRVRRKAERLKAEEQTVENASSHQEEVGIVDSLLFGPVPINGYGRFHSPDPFLVYEGEVVAGHI